MLKRFAPAALLLVLLILLCGCDLDESSGVNPTEEPVTGVDIVVPYATTTIAPESTQSPDALFINSSGKVKLNDSSVLDSAMGNQPAEPVETSPYTQLRLGSAGQEVSAMQERLAQLGYYAGGISGVFDEETEDAVKMFERGYGVMQTGIATAAMQERMFAEDAMVYKSDAYNEKVNSYYQRLEVGSKGSAVITLQTRLQDLGYPIRNVTGVYDEATGKAVAAFYEEYGYEGRSYAIPDMQQVLFSEDARTYGSSLGEIAPDGSPDLSIKSGDSGAQVTQLQIRLADLGYLENVTGEYDAETQQAVADFQTACHLESNGAASVETQKLLFAQEAPAAGEVRPMYVLLQWGDSGENVRALQTRLIALGYSSAAADGVFSDDTVAIVKRFQENAHLDQTGVASVELQEFLFSDEAPVSPDRAAEEQMDVDAAQMELPTLREGDSGENVGLLQQRLTELGYYAGGVDSQYGAGTVHAVQRFQEGLGVETTGVATPGMINMLFSRAAPKVGTKYWRMAQDYEELSLGDTGDGVVTLQKRLWQLGFLDKESIADSIGVYEENTAAAVNKILKLLECPQRDGNCSSEFLTVIYSQSADALQQ